jgi:perosamine synthetase
MQAAIGIAQMNKLDRIIEKKKAIYERYVSELGNISAFKPLAFADNITPVYWFTSFFTPYKLELADYLRENNIQTREFFYPLHKQPCYADMELTPKNYPVSSVAYETGISLPSSYALTTTQQDAVISQIKKFFGV